MIEVDVNEIDYYYADSWAKKKLQVSWYVIKSVFVFSGAHQHIFQLLYLLLHK